MKKSIIILGHDNISLLVINSWTGNHPHKTPGCRRGYGLLEGDLVEERNLHENSRPLHVFKQIFPHISTTEIKPMGPLNRNTHNHGNERATQVEQSSARNKTRRKEQTEISEILTTIHRM